MSNPTPPPLPPPLPQIAPISTPAKSSSSPQTTLILIVMIGIFVILLGFAGLVLYAWASTRI